MKRLLCIWLPNWPWQRLRGAQPELEGRPAALHEPEGRRRVAACSPAAAAAGVRLGMLAAEAAALLAAGPRPGNSPQYGSASQHSHAHQHSHGRRRGSSPFYLGPCDPHADREALAQLAQWCRRFSPDVSLLDAPEGDPRQSAADALLLDITGCAHLLGGDAALAQAVLAALVERRLEARVAVAETIGAAWAMAHAALLHAPATSSEKTPAAAVCTEHGRVPPPGSGWAVAAADETRLWLRALPIESLRLPAHTVLLLHELGVTRVEQLWQLPRVELTSRLGPALVRRLDEALGVQRELALPVPTLETPRATWTFDYPTARHEVLCGVLQRLAGPLLDALRQQTLGLRQAECWMRCQPAELDAEADRPAVYLAAAGGPGVSRTKLALVSLEFFQPTASLRHVVEMFGLRLAERVLPGTVVELGLEVLASGPLAGRQQRLFAEGPECESPRHVAQLIDRLSSRLGRGNVLRPQRTADAQPELAYRARPWLEQRPPALTPRAAPRRAKPRRTTPVNGSSAAPLAAANEVNEPPAPAPPPSARPLWLCPRPVSLQVWSVAPDGPPQRIRCDGQEHAVTCAWGPERIETGWWRRRAIGRDYYQVEIETGARWWLYRRLRDGRWFLHGWFD